MVIEVVELRLHGRPAHCWSQGFDPEEGGGMERWQGGMLAFLTDFNSLR